MDQRNNVGSFNNSSFNGNTNIQSDNNTQMQHIINEEDSQKAIVALYEEIQKISDVLQKEQAEFYADQLKFALEKKDMGTTSKMIKFLGSILGHAGSVASIASIYGITL